MKLRLCPFLPALAALLIPLSVSAAVTVENVTAKQRYPWNGKVDIACTVSGINGTTNGLELSARAVFPDSGKARYISHLTVVRDGTNSTNRTVSTNGDYRLVWDAAADLGEVQYTNMVVRVTIDRCMVQLWENGPVWAMENIGAENPWDYGYYFWWGDTVGYKRENNAWVASDGSSQNFSFRPYRAPTSSKVNDTLMREGWITADGVLAPEHDAAQMHWGGSWRMPTDSECSALVDNCDWTWTTTNGVSGYVVRGRGAFADASIFLPAVGCGYELSTESAGSSGCYWSSVPDGEYYAEESVSAYRLWFYIVAEDLYWVGTELRGYGGGVRPVQGFSE